MGYGDEVQNLEVGHPVDFKNIKLTRQTIKDHFDIDKKYYKNNKHETALWEERLKNGFYDMKVFYMLVLTQEGCK